MLYFSVLCSALSVFLSLSVLEAIFSELVIQLFLPQIKGFIASVYDSEKINYYLCSHHRLQDLTHNSPETNQITG